MRILYLIYAVSGALSLTYQVVWFRVFADRFGSTNLTFILVLCCFIGGLGAGALGSARLAGWLGRWTGVRDPLRVYGLVEALVSLSLLLTVFTSLSSPGTWVGFAYVERDGILRPSFAQDLLTVGGAMLCVFLPCALMGVTFPLLCKAYPDEERFPSVLYAWNTLGACAGVLLNEFAFLPRLGHDRTLFGAIAANLALGAFFLFRGDPGRDQARRPEAPPRLATGVGGSARALHYSVLVSCAVIGGFMTGAIEGDAFKRARFMWAGGEVAMSFISFWAILAIFLGSWTVRMIPALPFAAVKLAGVAAVAIYAWVYAFAFELRNDWIYRLLGGGLLGLLGFTGALVFPTLYPLSMLLPYVCNRAQTRRYHLGVVYGANTVAFCLGIVVFTWIAPAVNIFYSLKLILPVLLVLTALLVSLRSAGPLRPWAPATALAALAAAALLTPTGFDPAQFPPGADPTRYPVRAMRSNAAHTTYVVETPSGDVLYFDSHPMSGTTPAAQRYMRLMAHFPLLAQEEPRSALLICFGVGNTAAAIAAHESVRRIDIVDLNDQVFETAPEFSGSNQNVIEDPRVTLIHDDGRAFLARSERLYDLISSEPPPPLEEGVERLYSREYYESALEHLTPGGMMSQWLPTHLMPREAVELAIRTFVQVYPHSLLFVGQSTHYILVGGPSPIDVARIEERFGASLRAREDLAWIGIKRPVDVLARIVLGERALKEAYASGPVIGDKRNDWARFFASKGDAWVLSYDPARVLDEIGAERLRSHDELRGALSDKYRLGAVVPDFPMAAIRAPQTGH